MDGELIYLGRTTPSRHTPQGLVYRHGFGTGYQDLVFPSVVAAAKFAADNGLTMKGTA